MDHVRLYVAGYADSDAEEAANLATGLREELLELDVDDVRRPSAPAPPGAKGDAVAWAELVVTLAGSLPPLIGAVRSWLGRHPGASITVEIDGDRLILDEATAAERRQLVDAWLRRHGGG